MLAYFWIAVEMEEGPLRGCAYLFLHSEMRVKNGTQTTHGGRWTDGSWANLKNIRCGKMSSRPGWWRQQSTRLDFIKLLLVCCHPKFCFWNAGDDRRKSRLLRNKISYGFKTLVELGVISKEMGGNVVREFHRLTGYSVHRRRLNYKFKKSL